MHVRIEIGLLVVMISLTICIHTSAVAWANDAILIQHHRSTESSASEPVLEQACGTVPAAGFESIQIETSNIALYEQLFEAVLLAPVVHRADHPGSDSLRGYCFRAVLVVVRQDLRTPRPTGWVQLNFTVSDVAAVQEELERSFKASSVYGLNEEDRAKIVRFRLKPDVMRGNRRATRFELAGPEGFMIGFDQFK